MNPHAAVPLERRLLKHQMDILAGNMMGIALGSGLLALGTALMLIQEGTPKMPVLAWLLGLLTVVLLRLGAFQRFRRYGITIDNAPRWSVAAVISSGIAGAAWGTLSLLVFDPQDPLRLAILAIVVSAMMASSTNSVGAYWPASLAFSVLSTSAFTIQCLLDDSPSFRLLGILGILYLAFTTSYARSIARTIRESLLLRFENQALVSSLQEAKERAEAANLSKTRFLAAASHDLRQPIHAMNLCLPVLRRLIPDTSPGGVTMATVTERLQASLDTMGKLLHVLLDISRLDAGALAPRLEPCSVGHFLQTIAHQAQSQAETKGLVLRVVDRDHWVLCDAAMLQSMLSNLVHNAVRYTDRGGVLLGTRQRGDRIWIDVWDTGRGVPADEVPKLCEEFFQASNADRQHSQTRGFGLGLSIVQRMAQLCGGELQIRSHLGRGSRFSIALPLCRAGGPATATAASPKAPHRPRKLLVIDNDVQILAAIQDLMQSWGHQVIVAKNLDEALSKAVRHADEIEMALVDFHLGEQTTGVDAALMLRRLLKRNLPLVLLTGDTSPDVSQCAEQAGVQVIYKPVKPDTLQGIIEDCA